jgi:cysteinyl-tRNA synthetase
VRSLSGAAVCGNPPQEMYKFRKRFEEAMENDFNTANAVAAIFDFVKYINSSEIKITEMKTELLALCGILGINAADETALTVPLHQIEALIEQRRTAKESKNWAEADAIRGRLAEMGVVIKDTKDGVTWHIGERK